MVAEDNQSQDHLPNNICLKEFPYRFYTKEPGE
jgi:hypothetical protein